MDQSKWDIGLSGEPQDPWQHFIYVVLQDAATQELFTFTTSSMTGRRACGNLLRHYDRTKKNYPHDLPRVRLAAGGFKHKDPRVGWVNVPLFVVVGRTPRDGVAKPESTTTAESIDDDLPRQHEVTYSRQVREDLVAVFFGEVILSKRLICALPNPGHPGTPRDLFYDDATAEGQRSKEEFIRT